MRRIVLLFISLILSATSLSVLAQNDVFLNNTAMSYFTKTDWAIFNKTRNYALEHAKNGVKVFWSNPKSGAHGYILPSSADSQNGMVCRNLAFFNTANSIDGEGKYKFCKVSNNKGKNNWKIF